MVLNAKLRRHSGRMTPRSILGMKKSEIMEKCLEPQVYWDDWRDYRDGFRGSNDRKILRSRYMRGAQYLNVDMWNKKLRILIFRRRAKKQKTKYLYSI